AAVAKGSPAPVYLIVGDDEAEMSRLAADVMALVEDELRAFNVDRLYASEKSTTPASIVEACRTIPMMGDRRVVIVLRGERRLKLYTVGKPKITLADAQEIVSAEAAQDDWAVTNAITQRNTAEALRQLSLAMDAGAVPYMILGQLGWFVRDKLPNVDVRRVPQAVDALFRADLDLKSSGGDAKVLLERLVVELCGRGAPRHALR